MSGRKKRAKTTRRTYEDVESDVDEVASDSDFEIARTQGSNANTSAGSAYLIVTRLFELPAQFADAWSGIDGLRTIPAFLLISISSSSNGQRSTREAVRRCSHTFPTMVVQ